jgi:hypothetical protein
VSDGSSEPEDIYPFPLSARAAGARATFRGVTRAGLEPARYGLKVRCSTN